MKIDLEKILQSILAVLVGLLLYTILDVVVKRRSGKGIVGRFFGNLGDTYVSLARSALRYFFILATLVAILDINGVNVGGLMAGIGIVGVVMGLAIQDALKDVIRGFSLISDKYFRVGDIVEIGGQTGTVKAIGLKTTKIVSAGDIISMANRNIEMVKVIQKKLFLTVDLPYELKVSIADKVMQEIAERVQELEEVETCEYMGVKKLAESKIEYGLKIVNKQASTRKETERRVLRIILEVTERHNIQLPYQKLDVYMKR